MAVKTPSQIAQDYLNKLKSLKPTVNIDQTDSDWYIRSRVNGSVLAGVYADQRLIANDAFPQLARHEAIGRSLDLYLERDFNSATSSQGNVAVTGTAGQVISQGLQAVYSPNGNTYSVETATTLDLVAGTGVVPMVSVGTGQAQNLLAGAELTFSSPPAGLNPTAVVSTGGLSDARDPESDTEARAAVLERIRQPLTVGRETDYIQYAKAADPSVVSASVARYPYGLGTVGVYITSGTTDIDQAIDEGESITIIPSDALVTAVQAYLDANRPVTDAVYVFKPTQVSIDVTVKVSFAQGNGSTILSGQTLTQSELVQREVKRAIYKTGVGGRKLGSSGYVFASDVEETIDVALSSEPFETGLLPILLDRQVSDLAATGANRVLLQNEVPVPGTITVTVV